MAMHPRLYFRMKAQGLVAQSPLDHFFKTDKCAAAKKQDVSGINREEFLMWMFATALRRNIRDSPLENLQKRLLNALTGYVSCDRRILIFATDLIDFIDVD